MGRVKGSTDKKAIKATRNAVQHFEPKIKTYKKAIKATKNAVQHFEPKIKTNKKVKRPSKQVAKATILKIETDEKIKRPSKKTAQVTFNPKIEISDDSQYSKPNITIHDFKLSIGTGLPLLYNSRIFLMKIRKYNKKNGTIETTYLRRESPCDPPDENPVSGPSSNAHLRYMWAQPMDPPGVQQNNDPSPLLRCLENENDDPNPEEFYIDIKNEDDVYEFVDDDKFNDASSTSSEAAEKLKPGMFKGKRREKFPLAITDRTCLYKM